MSDSKLGGLPDLSYGDTVTLQPAPVVSFDPAAKAFSALADQVQSIMDPIMKQQAEEAGTNAVSRDAQGKPQVRTVPTVGPLSEAYNAAAKTRFLSEQLLDAGPKIATLKSQYADDPDGVRVALDQLTGSMLLNTPGEFQGALRNELDTQGRASLDELTSAKLQRDGKAASEAMRQVAEIRAGERQAPGPGDEANPVETIFLALTGESKAFESDLAQTLGPDDAHRVVFTSGGLAMCHSTFGGPGPRKP